MTGNTETSIKYEVERLSDLLTRIGTGEVVLDPPIQRQVVWPESKMIGLVDTIARGLPMGACTVYRETTNKGRTVTDQVIDGQQRLTAIKRFADGALKIDPDVVVKELGLDLEGSVNDEQAEWYHDHDWASLPTDVRRHFGRYELSIVVITGPGEVAVQTFTRMNAKAYPLHAQEIRNAVYKDGGFLWSALRVCDEFTETFRKTTGTSPDSGLVKLGATTAAKCKRMGDIELASQLIILFMKGPQNRRETIDDYYRSHGANRGKKNDEREKAADGVVALLKRVSALTKGGSLKNLNAGALGCPVEEQLYALVHALKKARISTKNFKGFEDEIRKIYSEFQRQVTLYQADEGNRTSYSDHVRDFAATFTGQKNSLPHREIRIATLLFLLRGIPSMAKGKFTEGQREILWALSKDHKCARKSSKNCEGKLTYETFQAGHKEQHRADGGPATIENGQIECGPCNMGTGDRT